MCRWSVVVGRVALRAVFVLLLASSTVSCDLDSLPVRSKPPSVVILQPVTGAEFEAGEEVDFVASATDSKGVSRIEFWVDGALSASYSNPSPGSAATFSAQHVWSDDMPGQHVLLARAYNLKGQASPDAMVFVAIQAGPTEAPAPLVASMPTPDAFVVPTATPAPMPVAPALVETPTALAVPVANPAPEQPQPTCGLITRFADFDGWNRGDEPHGTFTQTTEQSYAGSYSGKLAYSFPTGGTDYVVFRKTYPLGGHGRQISAWVYGDGSGHLLNAWIEDAGGEVWQFSFGQIQHTGWQQMTADLGAHQTWPNRHVSGPANGVVDYPISFHALALDDMPDAYTGSGVIYIDELACSEVAGAPAPAPPAAPTTGAPTAQTTAQAPPAPAAPPPPQGPASIEFWADDALVNIGDCTRLHWAVDNVREVYLDGQGVPGHGEKEVCDPKQGATSLTYTLHVVKADGSTEDRHVTVNVSQVMPAVVGTRLIIETPPIDGLIDIMLADPSCHMEVSPKDLYAGQTLKITIRGSHPAGIHLLAWYISADWPDAEGAGLHYPSGNQTEVEHTWERRTQPGTWVATASVRSKNGKECYMKSGEILVR